MTDETSTPEPATIPNSEDVEAHKIAMNANEPVDEDADDGEDLGLKLGKSATEAEQGDA
jgi:hypothetical protein